MVFSPDLSSVFKKSSQNRKITIYLSRREFCSEVFDSIEGVVQYNGDLSNGMKIYGQLKCSFRYGREEDETYLMGIRFQKDIILDTRRICCKREPTSLRMSKFQEKILANVNKEEPNPISIYPFRLKLPQNAPPSVKLYSSPEEKPFGVEYFIEIFVGENKNDNDNTSGNRIAFEIRKIQFAPPSLLLNPSPPSLVTKKGFLMTAGELELEASLNKMVYSHGEMILLKINVRNNTSSLKCINRIKVDLLQAVNVTVLHSPYKLAINSLGFREELPINPGCLLEKVVYLTPSFASAGGQRGIALDGRISNYSRKPESREILASSTLTPEIRKKDSPSSSAKVQMEWGIFVSYTVRVKIYLGKLRGNMICELPFHLMNPKPSSNKEKPVKIQSVLNEEKKHSNN